MARIGSDDGFILSPNYGAGQNYPSNSNCTWIIEAPAGKVGYAIYHITFPSGSIHNFTRRSDMNKLTADVAESVRASDTLPMFEATVCVRS